MGDLVAVLGQILLAALLGAVIGLDRELQGHAAGLRTNLLVAAAAAVFADVSVNAFAELAGYDPSRVASNVVTGVGFLGAGAIFAAGGRPRGLTTAAALWASAAAGLAVGVGRWQVAVGLVVVALLALSVLNALADRFLAAHRQIVRDLYVIVADSTDVDGVQDHLLSHDVRIRTLELVRLHDDLGIDLTVIGRQRDVALALETIHQADGVCFASDEKGIAETM